MKDAETSEMFPMSSGIASRDFDLPEGLRRKWEGVRRVESAASEDEVKEAWRSEARAWLVSRATRPGVFTADDLISAVGLPPYSQNAVGAQFVAASKAGIITAVGFRSTKRTIGNARTIRVWRGVINE